MCLPAGLADRGIAGHSAGRARDAGLVLGAFATLDFPPADVQVFRTDRGGGFGNVYGQINVYGVTTKSERHKRSYWTRTADGNGIGGRKAPVPYGS